MGDYSDFSMLAGSTGVAGICHKRAGNASLPSQWLIYIVVADLDKSIEACVSGGGKVINGPRNAGESQRYCVIEDPAGAVCALFQGS